MTIKPQMTLRDLPLGVSVVEVATEEDDDLASTVGDSADFQAQEFSHLGRVRFAREPAEEVGWCADCHAGQGTRS